MRKFLSVLLVLAMVLPLCATTGAVDTATEIKPFYISNTRDLQTGDDSIYPKIFLWSGANSNYVTEDEIRVSSSDIAGNTPQDLAESLKEVFDEYPEGMRYLRFGAVRSAMITLSEDVIFMEKGVVVMKKWFDEFISYYYSIGGKLDGIMTDIEYIQGESYWLGKTATEDPLVYQKIVSNPNYATKIRPALVERGFKFWPNVTEQTPEIYSIYPKAGEEYAQSRDIWDVVYRNHLNEYVNEALRDSFLKYYPNGILSDYQARVTYAWHKNLSDTGKVSAGGNHTTAGNANYFNSYGGRPALSFFESNGVLVYNSIPSYNNTVFQDNAFNMTLWDTINARNLYASAPDGNFTATITFYSFNTREGSYCNTPYYSEMTYHLGMLDPKPFQSFCIEDDMEKVNSDVDYCMQIIDELMDELTRIVGAADRKPIATPITWNSKYILSGMYAGGKNYWRITPDTLGTNTTRESFKVADAKDPTFTIEGQTVTFPGGKIIEDAKITEVGTCGYWVETAQDVYPVITYAQDRYEQYPAFGQDFEEFEANTNFNAMSVAPLNCWEAKKGKEGAVKIVADGDNKALAMSGTYELKLSGILKNITAGDSYAKNQAWEATVTVPSDMAADAETYLLNVYTDKNKMAEDGFKIAGGKIYYANAGTYTELAGVDVSAGGKFRLVRGMDFHNPDTITCDYSVYDANGNLLAEVQDVPCVSMKLPIERIGISVAAISGNPVLVDNLKLYANGVTTDFELYNATTGIQYTDIETEKDSDTAYRLSWMNATKYEKAYVIKAQFSDGTTKTIKEIKMAPGTDYVDTGVVEVPAGQTVKLSVHDISKPEEEQQGGTQNSTTDGATVEQNQDKNDSVMLIVTVVAAVVLVGLIVVAVLIVRKKLAATEENKEETEETTEE